LRRWLVFGLFAAAGLFLLCACLPEPPTPPPLTPIPSETPSPSPTITETVIWFPPTATFTPFVVPTTLPTPDMHPALGEDLLVDDFSGEPLWPVSRGASGSAAYGKGEFTLAVSAPRGLVMSLRPKPDLSNFYLEIDAFPSLCREKDAYGLMLRAQSTQDYYRALFTCGGEARVERVKGGKVTPLQDWVSSGQAISGALVKTRLGVWAWRDELRIFVNDVYLLSVRDPLWPAGKIGLLARAAGDTPLTVSFSNLRVRGIDPAHLPTRTPFPTFTPTPRP